MKLSEITQGKLISNSEYRELEKEMNNCFSIITVPNYELGFDVVSIKQEYIYLAPCYDYPYGKYFEVKSGDILRKSFRVERFDENIEIFDKNKKIKMLLCD